MGFEGATLENCSANELEHEYIATKDNRTFLVRSKKDAYKRERVLAVWNNAGRGNFSSDTSASSANVNFKNGVMQCSYGYSDANGTSRSSGLYTIYVCSPEDFESIASNL
jgi:hypothetical protein